MNHQRILGLLFVTALATAVAAQEPQPGDKKGPDDKGKDQPDLAARVAKNMKAAEERLKKTDPGDVTRKIQRDIVDDLDEMIKQNNKAQGGGGGKSSQKTKRKQSQDKSDGKAGPDSQDGQSQQGDPKDQEGPEQLGKAKGGKKDDGQGKDKDKGEGKNGQAKDGGDKDKGDKGQAKGNPGKDGKEGGGLGTAKRVDGKSLRNLAADMNVVEWGKLTSKMRLQMDVYSKERFMPRYDDLLRQYYRSIAEQSMKKDN
jgi:hypothetical protein